MDFALTAGGRTTLRVDRIPGIDGSALFLLDATGDRKTVRRTAAAQTTSSTLRDELARVRAGAGSVVVVGEPGSGRTWAAREFTGSGGVFVDAARIVAEGQREWSAALLATVDAATSANTVVVEHVHVAPDPVLRLLVSVLESGPRFVFTSDPLDTVREPVRELLTRCVGRVRIPALRHRIREIGDLAASLADELGRPDIRLGPGAVAALAGRSWPGNLAELRAVLAGIPERESSLPLRAEDLAPEYRSTGRVAKLGGLERAEREAIIDALRDSGGNKVHAAAGLGISRTTLYSRIKRSASSDVVACPGKRCPNLGQFGDVPPRKYDSCHTTSGGSYDCRGRVHRRPACPRVPFRKPTPLHRRRVRRCCVGRVFATHDPATGDKLVDVAHGGAEDIDRAVRAARSAFDHGPWPTMKAAERERMIWRVGDLLTERAEEFGQLEALDNGKSAAIAAAVDTAWSADIFRYYAGWATKIEGSTVNVSMPFVPGGEFHAYTLREPVGVCGLIVPWNFPLLMAAFKLAPALAAGNTVILKPAEQTPLTALLLAEVFEEAGFPPGVVNVVTGFGDAGAALSAHDGVDKIAFTGSTEVGKKVVDAAKGNLKKVSLELGGKSPNIVFADADFDAAVAGSLDAWLFNHGQCCVAGTRLFVERPIFEQFTEAMADAASRVKIGPGMDPATQLGPLVSQEQLDRVTGFLREGLTDGARALTGGQRWGDKGFFVEPTVLVDVQPEFSVVREEIFGPVVAAMPFDADDGIDVAANDSIYGLAAGIWTRDLSKAHRTARRLKAGSVWVNQYNGFDTAMPFGGFKQSGWGRELGASAIDLYTQTKAVNIAL